MSYPYPDPENCWTPQRNEFTTIAYFHVHVRYSVNTHTNEVGGVSVHFDDVPTALVRKMVTTGGEAFGIYIEERVAELIADKEGCCYVFEGGLREDDYWGVKDEPVDEYGLTPDELRLAVRLYKLDEQAKRMNKVMA